MEQISPKTVLTIDDDPSIRLLIRSALEQEQTIQVIEAGDGVAGLEAVKKHHPDLVLLDVVMPRQDGIHTLQALRSDPEIAFTPVILLTAVKEKDKLMPLLSQRNTDFMPKPFLLDILRSKVKNVLFPDSNGSNGQAH